jgi:zinc/manganese transport system substrate-binding protein
MMLRNPIVLATLLAVTLPGRAADRLHVVATTADLGALAISVGGDALDVITLARATEDPHFVDAKPSFIRTLNQADVLIEGGAALEAGWLPPLLDGARNPKIAAGAPGRVVASDGLALREVPSQLDRSLGDVHPFGNPHFLLDPVNAKTVARTIATALCAVDHDRCAAYEDGAKRFADAADAKLVVWEGLLAPVRGAKIVTFHKDFDYLAARFGLEVLDTLEPKPGIPPSPTHLAELVPRMQAAGARVILIEPFRERGTPDFVAEKTGAGVLVLPIMPSGKQASDYLGLIDYDVRQIAGALAKK